MKEASSIFKVSQTILSSLPALIRLLAVFQQRQSRYQRWCAFRGVANYPLFLLPCTWYPGMVPSAQFFSCLGRESSSLMVFLEEWFPRAVHQSILLQARGWLVGKVSLGRNGPIRITSFESSRCRSESSVLSN
jgi:hypothetical protein